MNKDTEKGILIGVAIGAASVLILSSRKVQEAVKKSAKRMGTKTEPVADKAKAAASKAKEEAVEKAGAAKKAATGRTRNTTNKNWEFDITIKQWLHPW